MGLTKMKFWQKRKKLEISESEQVYKVIYLGNVVTSWAKGESTLEKPLTTLWKNYCNNYASFYAKNGANPNEQNQSKSSTTKQFQSKQILMKLTICNQGLKALTREFGLTEYWANRITFCGQNSNFPRIFAWIYRHEGKRMKQELRVHACLVNKQVNLGKMIFTLQARLSNALLEFKREQKLKENSRRVSRMRDKMCLLEDADFSDEFDELDFTQQRNSLGGSSAAGDDEKSSIDLSQLSITSSGSKSLALFARNLSQSSLNSIRSKSSTSSSGKRGNLTYESNAIPLRKQLLVKGSKNFKEPLERTKSAPKLFSILEEFSSGCEQEEEDDFFDHRFDERSYSLCEEQFQEEEYLRRNFREAHARESNEEQEDLLKTNKIASSVSSDKTQNSLYCLKNIITTNGKLEEKNLLKNDINSFIKENSIIENGMKENRIKENDIKENGLSETEKFNDFMNTKMGKTYKNGDITGIRSDTICSNVKPNSDQKIKGF